MTLQLVVFDFDLTLSSVHIFNAVAGMGALQKADRCEPSIAEIPFATPPFAKTERGQLARLAEMDARPEFQALVGFALAAFGGRGRVGQLNSLLTELRQRGVECIICTRGLVGPVRRCLEQLGMLGFFTKVYGNIGAHYGTTEYDVRLSASAIGSDSRFLGGLELAGWGSKQQLVARCLQERGLSGCDAVFIDDDPLEVRRVHHTCFTIQVESPSGMSQREIDVVRATVFGQQASPPVSGQSPPSAAPVSRKRAPTSTVQAHTPQPPSPPLPSPAATPQPPLPPLSASPFSSPCGQHK